jgi:prepilin-type N-terminal cleavage/methylation domain-containing protein
MKQSFARPRLSKLSGFTLVELLVVMGIIAILAAVLVTAGGAALRAAARAKAANTANSIQTATLGYYTEYSVYPVPTGTTTDYEITDVTGQKTLWGNLICVLCGNVHPSAPGTVFTPTTILNSRGIAFLSLKASDVDANDAPLNPLPTGTGANAEIYFNLAIDSDYDGLLGTTAPTQGTMPNFTTSTVGNITTTGTSTAGVAVWANCNGNASTTMNPNFYVHTY